MWVAILVASVGCYALKLAGLSLPQRVLEHPVVERVADLDPGGPARGARRRAGVVAGSSLTVDARTAGLGFAVGALLLRAPFLVVVLGAAVTAALLRLAV